jgi:hypothetical protein
LQKYVRMTHLLTGYVRCWANAVRHESVGMIGEQF